MFILKKAFEKQLKINEELIANYQEQLNILPKGSIVIKKQNTNIYYYIKYREGKHVKTDYIGKDIKDIKDKLEIRKHIYLMLKTLKKENEKLLKIQKEL